MPRAFAHAGATSPSSVSSATTNLRRSPKASAWPISGFATSTFSTAAGEMFSPPEVMISSFFRSTTADEPVGVDGADVAGVQPAVVVEQRRGLLGQVQVAGRVQRAAGEDLAVVGDLHLDAGHRPADGAEPERGRRVRGERAGRLGHPVDVQDLHAEPGEERGDLGRQRRRRADHVHGLVEAEQALDRASAPARRPRRTWRRARPTSCCRTGSSARTRGRSPSPRPRRPSSPRPAPS